MSTVSPAVAEAKARLDSIIRKARVDLYKPIQIAEVLHRSRTKGDVDVKDVDSYRNESLRWRNVVSQKLLGKQSSSSAQFQHNLWAENAMPPRLLAVLDAENRRVAGQVERYIYMKFKQRQSVVAKIIDVINAATAEEFQVGELFALFRREAGIRRSIDKAYEIVAHSLFETLVTGLEASVKVSVPESSSGMLSEFDALASMIPGVTPERTQRTQPAHIYRAGVTNAADRGLDMWANFGPAIQVKHLPLDEALAKEIINQVESDQVVIVCQSAEASVLRTVRAQLGWGRRVRGVVTEQDLIDWHERCLRGSFSGKLAAPLLKRLREGFKAEFPQVAGILEFFTERGYLDEDPLGLWQAASIAT
ncbi:MAG TPA: HaeII family restriction endonuclease [Pyrinomonadaceae bacterium]|jgi:type II restriction enzyme